MTIEICSVEECDRPRRGRGFCLMHYKRFRKHGTTTLPTWRDRLLSKISPEPNSGCWLWTGNVTQAGYGVLRSGGKDEPIKYAHRLMYEMHYGFEPSGKVVRHKCDNPLCVNPEHLLIGTQADNVQDAVDRKRMRHGSNHPNSKLNEFQVSIIRKLNLPLKSISDIFGVGISSISQIRNNLSWEHV